MLRLTDFFMSLDKIYSYFGNLIHSVSSACNDSAIYTRVLDTANLHTAEKFQSMLCFDYIHRPHALCSPVGSGQ